MQRRDSRPIKRETQTGPMRSGGKTTPAQAGKEIIQVIKDGKYKNEEDDIIDIKDKMEYSLEHTKCYTPEDLNLVIANINSELKKTETKRHIEYRFLDMTTGDALKLLDSEQPYTVSKIGVLNFASAKNPGGGYKEGVKAQEEALARCSTLVYCLTSKKVQAYYNTNREICKTKKPHYGLYTDYTIYSEAVPFIRDDNFNYYKSPIYTDIVTSPAVNYGVIAREEGETDSTRKLVKETMIHRIEGIISLFSHHKVERIVLGAFGCGVFRLSPILVASAFKQVLEEKGLGSTFKEIVFAIPINPRTREKNNELFRRVLEKRGG